MRLHAGYGRMEVLRGVSLRVARGRSLCLVGPNGAGKSTVLNAILRLCPHLLRHALRCRAATSPGSTPSEKLKTTRLAYVLQRDSVFPDMTVEENLLMGGYLLDLPSEAKRGRRGRARPLSER